jgi:hypothetical protein
VKVDHSSLDAMRQIYAPPDHPVFLLVPQEFSQQASLFMAELGSPPVTGDNVWNVYADLLMCFQSIERDEGIHKLLAAQLPLPGDGDNLIGSEDLPIVDLPPFVEGSGPGSDMGIEKGSDEEMQSRIFMSLIGLMMSFCDVPFVCLLAMLLNDCLPKNLVSL